MPQYHIRDFMMCAVPERKRNFSVIYTLLADTFFGILNYLCNPSHECDRYAKRIVRQ